MGTDHVCTINNSEKGWFRKFYRQGSDELHFDLMPATEKAIAWLGTLTERTFIGTESRLLTLFELLKQINAGSETDPAVRIAGLRELCDRWPLRHGLAELVAYLELSSEDFSCTIDEVQQESIVWWGRVATE